MPAEAEPVYPIIIENSYKSLDDILSKSSVLPQEFSQGRTELNEYDKNRLAYEGSEAIWLQIKFLIDELKNKDPDNFKRRALNLIDKNEAFIFPALKEDILNYIKLS